MNDFKEWLRGYTDCVDGVPHKKGESVAYDDGYNYCYQKEQIDGAER